MKSQRMAKRSSFGSIVRKRLSDITNSQAQPKMCEIEEKENQVSNSNEDFINKLLREKATLVKLIEERNKIIELSGNELRNLRMNYQKLQLQNWNLAQSNSHILAELNVGREKLKALQHELVLKDALQKAKNSELQGRGDANCQKSCISVSLLIFCYAESYRTQLIDIYCLKEGEKSEADCFRKVKNDAKTSSRNRRPTARSHSMGPSTAQRQGTEKEKVENKRRCLRRQSARFKSQEREPAEDLFEIEDAKFPDTQPLAENPKQDGTSLSNSSMETEGNWDQRNGKEVTQRSSIGRPLRKAAVKVQSYKEVPVNVKMRRVE
ncbi:hypothetical protein K2173_014084 [Erythroxylum novogranatense]|uniref:Shugoshin C-terminal domain-containing protein n=1 Tax=Erythroxylum novogranatense TaxID=1862640 RepID=A0AAV8SDQ1_9ROSI|nr:hypothetical protein K2173_014084 [Erythroxylum novogranatense]